MRLPLQHFSEVFKIRDALGRPYVLVGGQAVNYWAEHYLVAEPTLKKLMPFTSQDIDFKGNRDDVRHIATQLNQTPVYPAKVAMTALAGVVPLKINRQMSAVEIVRVVPGVSAAAVDSLAVQVIWAGQPIRVLDPVSLLACKLELAFTVSQKDRQDEDHLRILVPCARGFLRDFLNEVEHHRLPAKGWLGAANKILGLSKTAHGRKASKALGVDWFSILPLTEIMQGGNPKIVQFREKQLPRWPH